MCINEVHAQPQHSVRSALRSKYFSFFFSSIFRGQFNQIQSTATFPIHIHIYHGDIPSKHNKCRQQQKDCVHLTYLATLHSEPDNLFDFFFFFWLKINRTTL